MRHYLLAAGALSALAAASPALARDGQPYFGIEAGRTFMEKAEFDIRVDDGEDIFDFNDAADVNFKSGLDADFVAGYDFGMFRGEAEFGLKRLRVRGADVSDEAADFFGIDDDDDFDIDARRESILSLMANGLVDFGSDAGINFYAGAGIGRARVNLFDDKDSAWAGQLIAGVRMPVSDSIDVGLKYRYFRTARLEFGDDEFGADGRFSSHSVLGSLLFNFGEPAVEAAPPVVEAPPPPPPAPATQTCPDGSVILATDACPAPPPPPPAPAGERG